MHMITAADVYICLIKRKTAKNQIKKTMILNTTSLFKYCKRRRELRENKKKKKKRGSLSPPWPTTTRTPLSKLVLEAGGLSPSGALISANSIGPSSRSPASSYSNRIADRQNRIRRLFCPVIICLEIMLRMEMCHGEFHTAASSELQHPVTTGNTHGSL